MPGGIISVSDSKKVTVNMDNTRVYGNVDTVLSLERCQEVDVSARNLHVDKHGTAPPPPPIPFSRIRHRYDDDSDDDDDYRRRRNRGQPRSPSLSPDPKQFNTPPQPPDSPKKIYKREPATHPKEPELPLKKKICVTIEIAERRSLGKSFFIDQTVQDIVDHVKKESPYHKECYFILQNKKTKMEYPNFKTPVAGLGDHPRFVTIFKEDPAWNSSNNA